MRKNKAVAAWMSSEVGEVLPARDRKSTRLNSSHGYISYAVFCLKKKKPTQKQETTRDQRRRLHTRPLTQLYCQARTPTSSPTQHAPASPDTLVTARTLRARHHTI